MKRGQNFDYATPELSEAAVHFHEAEAAVGENRHRGSREQAPVYVQCEPKDNKEVAHQQLPSIFLLFRGTSFVVKMVP